MEPEPKEIFSVHNTGTFKAQLKLQADENWDELFSLPSGVLDHHKLEGLKTLRNTVPIPTVQIQFSKNSAASRRKLPGILLLNSRVIKKRRGLRIS